MSRHYTGRDGTLYVAGAKVGRVRDWALNGSVEVLDTTTLGDFAETSIAGNLSYTGSCTVLTYEGNNGVLDGLKLVEPVFRTTANNPEGYVSLDLRLENGSKLRRIQCKAVISEADIAASAGDLTEWGVSFTVTGPLTEVRL
jgi:hypothetical protein